ncbi:hypothetical protein [Wenzhouxiangella sediminis]|uniref:Glycosyltransferase RgtA/B/C/D-like domain-containing protein n=1 Tax=Wenzhouxiangella sediminis TaxID=1792836 RepID=A0A3E1KBT2_9GAMM|nr:hypothetical protein [Wenzhouxiangella sediminis]RFF32033.1 hypothetical protein DZC52_03305 [Wenzhouxiangella sediminis]
MNPASIRSARPLWLLTWAVVLVVGAGLRLWQIDIQILLDDEWHALHRLMQADYSQIFLSFGHADYSIPLTLLFRALADTVGLYEWQMRLLPMISGLAALLVVPALLRPWLRSDERLGLTALMAISPLLIHFSRYVRPYAMVVLLGFAAMILLWQWWRCGGRARAVGFFCCAVAAAWLHPLTTLYTGFALTWFTLAGIGKWRRGEGSQALWRVLALGLLTTAACSALILPPLLADTASIAVKTGKHSIELQTLARGWEMVLGVGHLWLAGLLALPVLLGGFVLWQRDRMFVLFWVSMTLVATLIIQVLGPEWIRNALVLVRYTVLSMPIVLALLAVGLVRIGALAAGRPGSNRPWGLLGVLLAAAGLYSVGPLPATYKGINQFTNSARYQIDYNFDRSIFSSIMGPVEAPAFYAEIASEPGSWRLVEAAWHFETHFTPITEFQRDHQLPIRIGMISGLCTDWTWGELRPGSDLEIHLDRFVFLREILSDPGDVNRFVVFPLDYPFEYEPRKLPDLQPCIAAFEERFGAPWHRGADYVVFRIPGSAPEDGA